MLMELNILEACKKINFIKSAVIITSINVIKQRNSKRLQRK